MNENIVVFTRKALRDIAPDLTRRQEDAIIDLYIEASKKFKDRAGEYEEKLNKIRFLLRDISEQ